MHKKLGRCQKAPRNPLGFPVFHGGICRWMDEQGLGSIVERADKYTKLSELYRPTEKLRQMAANGESLYG